jgi:hypothetical protein
VPGMIEFVAVFLGLLFIVAGGIVLVGDPE